MRRKKQKTELYTLAETLEQILEIQSKYCLQYISKDFLIKWVSDCVLSVLCHPVNKNKVKFAYNKCDIEFLSSCGLFSVIKHTDREGYSTGILYDIALDIKPYLRTFFGTDRIAVLKAAMKWSLGDVEELATEIAEDIHDWSEDMANKFEDLEHEAQNP